MGRFLMRGVLVVALWTASNGLAQQAAAAARADNQFGFALLRQCRQILQQPNLFLSPPSLTLALSMVANGARGGTFQEMTNLLRTPAALDVLNNDNHALMEQLRPSDSKIQLEIANSLWIDSRAVIKPDFLSVNKASYQARIGNADFRDPSALREINHWVSKQTHGKIATIVDRLDPMLRLIVLNAIYFKGDWTIPFNQTLTRDEPFTLGNGKTIQHPRMKRTGKFQYVENDSFQAISLPYAQGEICMDLFLPRMPLNQFLQSFTCEKFQSALRTMQMTRGTIELPRFRLENEYNLKEVLQAMGMRQAFTPQADLSGISPQPLFIGWVKQKTFVDVNEKGTTAAAVTGIGVTALLVRREPPPFHMVVDRPFLVAIRNRTTGLILFLGTISDPSR